MVLWPIHNLNAKDTVTVPSVPLTVVDSLLTDGQGTVHPPRTPLDWAKCNNDQEMIKLLEAAAAR